MIQIVNRRVGQVGNQVGNLRRIVNPPAALTRAAGESRHRPPGALA
jgi:hypothetical protein